MPLEDEPGALEEGGVLGVPVLPPVPPDAAGAAVDVPSFGWGLAVSPAPGVLASGAFFFA